MDSDGLVAEFKLNQLRENINGLDEAIIEAIARRSRLSLQIGELKQCLGIKVFDPQREEALSHYHSDLSNKYNVSDKLISDVFALIINQSRVIQYQGNES